MQSERKLERIVIFHGLHIKILLSYWLLKLGKSGRRKFSPKDFSTITSYSGHILERQSKYTHRAWQSSPNSKSATRFLFCLVHTIYVHNLAMFHTAVLCWLTNYKCNFWIWMWFLRRYIYFRVVSIDFNLHNNVLHENTNIPSLISWPNLMCF